MFSQWQHSHCTTFLRTQSPYRHATVTFLLLLLLFNFLPCEMHSVKARLYFGIYFLSSSMSGLWQMSNKYLLKLLIDVRCNNKYACCSASGKYKDKLILAPSHLHKMRMQIYSYQYVQGFQWYLEVWNSCVWRSRRPTGMS